MKWKPTCWCRSELDHERFALKVRDGFHVERVYVVGGGGELEDGRSDISTKY